jgi:hypothetical protein
VVSPPTHNPPDSPSPDDAGSASSGAAPDVAADASNPRAFAQGAGLIFQTSGLILTFASCCVGSFFGLIQKPDREVLAENPPQTVVEHWQGFQTHQKLATISVFLNVAAGLGLLAAGIGMQHDRYGSPRLGVMVTLPCALFHTGYLVYLLIAGPIRIWLVAPLLLAAMWVVFALLALISAQAHSQHPPPRGVEVLPRDAKLPSTMGERLERELRGREQD